MIAVGGLILAVAGAQSLYSRLTLFVIPVCLIFMAQVLSLMNRPIHDVLK